MKKVAVYGTLRQGFGNHDYFLTEQDFLGGQEIEIPYVMISLGGFPGLVSSDKKHKIVIEVYEVDEEAMRSIDGLEGYPHFYNRVEIDTKFGKAWIYVLNRDEYPVEKVVESGDWLRYRNKLRNAVLSKS